MNKNKCIITLGDEKVLKNEDELLLNLNDLLKKNKYEDALNLIEENSSLITKKYYDICKIKIECLIQTNKLIDASVLIKEELSIPYVPTDFEKFLLEKKKLVSNKYMDKMVSSYSIDDIEKIDLVDETVLNKMLSSLKNFNLRPYVDKLQNVLDNPNISNITKTLFIASLSDNKLDANLNITKDGKVVTFNPLTVFDIREGKNHKLVQKEIYKIANIDANVLENAYKLIMTYLINIYPLELSDNETINLIAACLNLSCNLVNVKLENEKYLDILAKNKEEIENFTKKINNILENV